MPEPSNVIPIDKYKEGWQKKVQVDKPSLSTEVTALKWYKRDWYKRKKCQKNCKQTRQNISWVECMCFTFLALIACLLLVLACRILFPLILGPVFILANIHFLAGFLLLVYMWKVGFKTTKHERACPYYK